MTLLKGCKVYCARSWQRVQDRIIASSNKEHKEALFMFFPSYIASEISNIPARKDLENAFSVLCKEKKVGVINGFMASDATLKQALQSKEMG